MMPPPNITGQLHMGHALDETYQDTLIRFKRMQGYCALWLPGTDHASIATEVKIVEQLKKQGIAVMFVSSELPEVLGIADRVIVMCDGQITGEVMARETTQNEILTLATRFENKMAAGQ